MKLYELTYLLSFNVSEEEVNSFQEKINSFIQKEGGILDFNSQKIIKKRLGHALKGERTAYLIALNFQLLPEKLDIIEKNLKAESQVLRHAILVKKIRKESTKVPRRPREFFTAPISAEKTKEKKVELKEIEKKLEEILNE